MHSYVGGSEGAELAKEKGKQHKVMKGNILAWQGRYKGAENTENHNVEGCFSRYETALFMSRERGPVNGHGSRTRRGCVRTAVFFKSSRVYIHAFTHIQA